MSFDGKEFGREIVSAVKDYVDSRMAPASLQQAFDQGFEALKGYVDRSLNNYAKRIDDLERRIDVSGYQGVHEEGREYVRGQMVTSKGSIWHCNRPTRQRPGDCGDWTLAVKAGRDGKDAR